MRLDAYMVKNGLASGRDRAKELIALGFVTVDGRVITKPSIDVEEDTAVSVAAEDDFVGRGAKKIKKAFECFDISVEGETCLDAGASTGGFTDYMLRRGAARVYAVDVGHSQLAPALLADERVINLERTDIRSLRLDEKCTFFTCDVSFISLKQVLPSLYRLTDEGAEGVCLIKPQFEAGRGFVGKKGIVKDRSVHLRVIEETVEFARKTGFFPSGLTFSPVTGQGGNIEFLLYLKKKRASEAINAEDTVNNAWEVLL